MTAGFVVSAIGLVKLFLDRWISAEVGASRCDVIGSKSLTARDGLKLAVVEIIDVVELLNSVFITISLINYISSVFDKQCRALLLKYSWA